MATVALETFLPEVLPGVEGVSSLLALAAIRNSCMEFCRRTLAWTDTVDDAYIEGVAEYDLTVPAGAQVVKTLSVVLDGRRALTPVSLDAVDSWGTDWRTTRGVPGSYVQVAAGTINMVAVPNSSGSFVARIACAPTPKSTQVGSDLYDTHLEAIKHGALYRLRSVAGTPWFDASAAAFHQTNFQHGISMALVDRNRSDSRAALRVSPVPFV